MLAKKVYISLQLSLQTDILHYNHDCHVVIMMCHKYASGETVTFYGTEGEGVSFIGNKSDIKTSDGGAMAVKLFRKFMEGITTNDIYKHKFCQLFSPNSKQNNTTSPGLSKGV